MAVTKTHPIKSTLKKAIDYILNPEKTDGKLLTSSFACGIETADIEFEMTHRQSPQRGSYLARHLIQSFKPGETTPEQAHEIGMRLAEEVLRGKYEFVLATHTDRGNIHNHIIFNSVSFIDFKKYHSNKYTYRNIRRISDRLCEEYGLSVIAPGKSFYNNKKNRNINLIIDIQNSIKAHESRGYEHWAKVFNLKQAAKTLNFLTEHKISTYARLAEERNKAYSELDSVSFEIKEIERSIAETSVAMKNRDIYDKLKPMYEKYISSADKNAFRRKNESLLVLFDTAKNYIAENHVPPYRVLKASYYAKQEEKAAAYRKYKILKQQCSDLDTIKNNVDMILGNREKDRELLQR